MRWIAVVVLAIAVAAAAPPTQMAAERHWNMGSPDGRTELFIDRQQDGRLTWRLTRDRQVVIADSPLGIRRADQTFDAGLSLVGMKAGRTLDERYSMPYGKRKEHHIVAREWTLTFANPSGGKLDLIVRLQDDGAAFRYRFPGPGDGPMTVVEERTGFHLPQGSTAWMMPQQAVDKYGPAYEDLYREVPSGTASERSDGWAFPALFKTATGKWALITESALDETYCGSHLAQNAPDGVYQIKFPDPKEGLGIASAAPASTMPWTMPWRVVIVGDEAGRIAESDLVLDLAPASRITDTSWIKPGRSAWSWWSKSDSPKHAEDLNAFTDLAAEMGWEYALVDANWNLMESGSIEDVIAHAKAKNVGLFFWYNSGGPHNDVTEAPRDRMFTRDARRAEFQKLKAWGVRGVKVDFWQSDKQARIAQYRDLLRDAADFQLMVNFHGSTIPRGWSREFPNLIGMEAVAGAEQYKFNEGYAARAPWLNTVLPFTRNVAGPMDFTPVTFSDAKYPHQTTNAHELALSIVFETPIQHFADSIESYRAVPEPAKTFLKQVPTAWDETRVLSGEPGGMVVIARRNGNSWWVGGINGHDAPVNVEVKLDFLKDGQWRDRLVRDNDRPGGDPRALTGIQQDVVRTPSGSIRIPKVHAHGGFVMRFERAPQPRPESLKPLDIYFVDVEGGQATLLVTPAGESMLIDTGYPGLGDRDINRVLATIGQAGLTRLDYLLVTHYHADHVGNAAAIAARIPVGTFIDHGESVETDETAKALYAGYLTGRASGHHLLAKPGDKVPLRGLDITIVTAGGEHITRPLAAPRPNPDCAAFKPKDQDPSENARSVGSVIAFGRFRMVDLGDLTWNKEQELVCPNNLLGTVDLYLTTHHGLAQSNAPVIVRALHPRVAIMNNGPTKGGSAEAIQTVKSVLGLEDFWQLHYSIEAAAANMPPAMIANLDDSAAHYLKVSAQADGSFTVTNSRTNETRSYKPR